MPQIDLTHAVVVAPAGRSGPEARAVEMLVDKVETRSPSRSPCAAIA